MPFLLATPVLFLLGAVTVYYVVIPIAWEFFVSFEQIGGQGTLPMELEPLPSTGGGGVFYCLGSTAA